MKKSTLIVLASMVSISLHAADDGISSASVYLNPFAVSDVIVPFDISAKGVQLPVRWGMDTAWNSTANMQKGINHIGADNITIARAAFQTTYDLTAAGELTDAQITVLQQRIANIDLISKDVDIVLTEDQDAGIISSYVTSGKADVDKWCKLIAATVNWIHTHTQHKVVGVSPFNEPDYGWGQGSIADLKAIAQKLKTDYPAFANIAIIGGNTLNDDKASTWYNYMKPYVQWGNTHQLAGSFDNYAAFFTEVKNDGNYGVADELHNVGEAMVGAEYGMKAGIWWGFEAQARGKFCEMSNHGTRLGYGENRSAWTAASVYRNDSTQEVAAFLGSSERQATTSSYLFISKDRDVYYDGYGPTREYRMEVPGGTAYQTGQINAERYIQVNYGEDVPVRQITQGNYKIVNAYSGMVMSAVGSAFTASGANVCQLTDNNEAQRQWRVVPTGKTASSDYSYYRLYNSRDTTSLLDVLNFSNDNNANVLEYAGNGGDNEQWLFVYAGNGNYRIKNRGSNLYLQIANLSKNSAININQGTYKDNAQQLWRIIPITSQAELKAPAQPTGLHADNLPAAVALNWTANTETDMDGYNIIRKDMSTGEWNTVARRVNGTVYVDNNCVQGHSYIYKIKAIDKSDNLSAASDSVTAAPTCQKAMIAQWQMEGNLNDATQNDFHAVALNKPTYNINNSKQGTQALILDGTNYVQLPYQVANMKQMTICFWTRWTGSGSWQRLFDFGNGTTQYMFLTPSNGTEMRLVLKNGGEEQVLGTGSTLKTFAWTHIAVVLSDAEVAIYQDGVKVASSTVITIRPSDFAPVLNYLGRSQFSADPYFKGYYDDVRIYNEALDADAIKSAMNGGTTGVTPLNVTKEQQTTTVNYTLEGTQARQGQRGLLIQKCSDGTVKKVVCK